MKPVYSLCALMDGVQPLSLGVRRWYTQPPPNSNAPQTVHQKTGASAVWRGALCDLSDLTMPQFIYL